MLNTGLTSCLAAVAALVLAAPAHAADLVVDDDGLQCTQAQYTTIQAAVDAAAIQPGTQRIRVCAGTYAENVLIGAGNSVQIVGDGTSQTIVTGVAGTAGPIIAAIDAGRVTLENLTVDGQSAMAAGQSVIGIRFRHTSGEIRGLSILNIRDAAHTSSGFGIRIESLTGADARVDVRDSLVQNYTRVGVFANGIGADLQASGNVIVGPTPPRPFAPNGFQVSRGAGGQIRDNIVQDSLSPVPASGSGSGILLFCAAPMMVQGNAVSSSDLGIALVDTAGSRVVRNDVRTSGSAFALQFIGSIFGPLGCPTFPSPTKGNHLTNNTASASTEYGISLISFDLSDPMTPEDNHVVNTTITGSGIDGIRVFSGAFNRFTNNRINGSTEHDAHDDTTGAGTGGTANFWVNNRCQSPPANRENTPGLCK